MGKKFVQLGERYDKTDIESYSKRGKKPKIGSIMKNESYGIYEFVTKIIDIREPIQVKTKLFGIIPVTVNIDTDVVETKLRMDVTEKIEDLIINDVVGKEK